MQLRHALGGLILGCWSVTLGCPSPKVDEPQDTGSRIGRACSVDTDCGGAICVGGICVSATDVDSGVNMASSGGATSGPSSSSHASSGIPDAGQPDLYVPHGLVTTSPATGPIEFGAQRIGQSVEKTVLVSNTGDAPISVVSLGFRNNPTGEFTLSVVGGVTPSMLAAGDQFTVRVTHTPSDASPDHAFLSLVTSATNPLVELELVAEFKGDAAMKVHTTVADNGPDATLLAIPPVALNASGTAHLYVKNTGAADSALTVTSVVMNPVSSTVFSVNAGVLPRSISSFAGPCATVAGCGAGAADCTGGLCVGSPDAGAVALDVVDVAVTFNAINPGAQSMQLTITATAGTQTLTRTIDVTALGQIGRLEVTPDPIVFGETFIGLPKVLAVRITNAGNALAEIASLGMQYNSPAAYTLDLTGLTFPYSLTPGSFVDVPVTFSPPGLGSFNNFLQIPQVAGMTTNIEVSGLGANAPNIVVPAEINFGASYVGTAHVRTLTINNNAAGLLRINRAFVNAPGNSPFTFGPNTFPTPIPLSGTQDITVTYAPSAIGPEDTTDLVIESNDPDTPAAHVTLRGTPVRPVATVTPSPAILNFGPQLVGGTPAVQTVTIRNVGVGDLMVDSNLVVRDAMNNPRPEFAVALSRPLPTAVNAGAVDNVVFTVTFTPVAATLLGATFRITTSDPQAATVDVQLSGGGSSCTPMANATVAPGPNNTCVYTCLSGYHSCSNGAACLSNTSPDSCGTSCTPCETRDGTSRGCTAATSTCTYACVNPNYDLDGDRNLPQGAVSDGCEYACPVTTPSTETCDGIDNNCNGVVDDGLPQESPEPASACSGGLPQLASLDSTGGISSFPGYSVYPAGDGDWFKIHLHEVSSTCFPFTSQNFTVTVQLQNIQPGVDLDITADTGCGVGHISQLGAGQNESISWNIGGTCSSDDSTDIYVHVYGFGSTYSCFPYLLKAGWSKN